MTDTARNIEHLDPASTDGLADLFDVETEGVTQWVESVTSEVSSSNQGETEGNYDLLTLAEAARALAIPYTTFYKQVKAGKHHTVPGPDGKPRIKMQRSQGETIFAETVIPEMESVTPGVTPCAEGVTQLKQLEIIQDLMQKLEGANYRVGWLESQLREREADVHELKLLVDTQHKPSWWQRLKQIWQKQ
jgi:hypothetical protein